MPAEDRGGDVGGEVGEPKKLAEVGSVQLLPLRQIAELAAFVLDQQVMEAVGADDQPLLIRRWAVSSGGCRPEAIASTMSGASRASGNRLLTYRSLTPSTEASSARLLTCPETSASKQR
jgi:hypothetical protein